MRCFVDTMGRTHRMAFQKYAENLAIRPFVLPLLWATPFYQNKNEKDIP